LVLASLFAQADRARLRRWGLEITAPRYRARGHGAAGTLRLVTDPRRWLDLAFESLIALPVRLLTAGPALVWAGGAAAAPAVWSWGRRLPVGGAAVPGQWALALVVGLALALSLPAMVHALALLDAVVSAPLLGGAATRVRPGPGTRPVPPPSADGPLRDSAWTR